MIMQNKYTIPYFDSSLFDWITWRSGSIHDLGIVACREVLITSPHGKEQLRKYAIGFCFGENLPCRPKHEMAVMFEKNDITFWFHLRLNEFNEVFKID
jgi:hypothetical protein